MNKLNIDYYNTKTRKHKNKIDVIRNNFIITTIIIIIIIIIIIMSVLPKGRSFISSTGTKAAILPKAGLPPQTQEPRLQFYQG